MNPRPAKRRSPEVRTPRPSDWRPDEVAQLRALYPLGSREALQAAIPGRTWIAIRRQACALGIVRRLTTRALRWKPAELALLRKLYPTQGVAATCKALPGYTEIAIRRQAYNQGLKALRITRQPTARQLSKRATAAAKEKREREARLAALLADKKQAKQAQKRSKLKAKAKKPAPKPAAIKPAPKAVAPAGLHAQSPRTSNANAQKAQRLLREQAKQQQPAVTAEMLRKLPGAHPARLAFTRAAKDGPAAAAAAYYHAMQQAA